MSDEDVVQLVYYRKQGKFGLKAVPRTATEPTVDQAKVRQVFGDAVRSARGARGLIEGLPVGAARAREEVTGFRSSGRSQEHTKVEETLIKELMQRRRLTRQEAENEVEAVMTVLTWGT